MSETTINIETLLAWSEPKEVRTVAGPRILRKAQPNAEFQRVFGSSKKPGPAYEALRAAGIGWAKDQRTGEWEVAWWGQISAAVAAKQNEAIVASRAVDADVAIPCPEGLAYMGFQRAGIAFMLRVFGGKV